MTTEEILFDVEDRMEKSIAKLKRELAGIRTGRANPGLVDSVKVIAYGVEVPLKQVATVACPEPTQILIRPFDASTLKDIEKGIMNSELGYAPNNDGKVIRLSFPPLTEERRREMTKQIAKMGETAKVAIRNIRRDANDKTKQLKKDGDMTEDEVKQSDKIVQDLTDKYIKIVDQVTDLKNKEIMEI